MTACRELPPLPTSDDWGFCCLILDQIGNVSTWVSWHYVGYAYCFGQIEFWGVTK